ncbi:hypothetical protein, partial [Klebsiella pneumoniae]|uniref:hypothetical protein n=1 Tax=Klebsiella pneumoniae TaxID=573 RepID=UPI0025A21CD7
VVPAFHTWCHMKRNEREMRHLSQRVPLGSHVPGGRGTTGKERGPRLRCPWTGWAGWVALRQKARQAAGFGHARSS